MFSNVVQPSVVSLFSSTGSAPLQLFSKHVDPSPALRSDSLIHFLNDATSTPAPPEPGALIRPSSIAQEESSRIEEEKNDDRQHVEGTLCQTVLHIQSPTLRTTYIRCPPHQTTPAPSGASVELGLTLPWMHMQACRLDEREWAFEVGISDRAGRKGVIRCSTFQKEASVAIRHGLPLLHVPLHFPTASSQPLTPWSTISIDLASMIQQFHIIGASQQTEVQGTSGAGGRDDSNNGPYHRAALEGAGMDAPLPSGSPGRVTYIKVYANCRLRRLWFSENGHRTLPWELELYA